MTLATSYNKAPAKGQVNYTSRRLFFELVHKAHALKHYRRLERRAILLGMMYVFFVMREDFELADCIRRRIINPDCGKRFDAQTIKPVPESERICYLCKLVRRERVNA